jgi:dihydroorotate dehydrogenase
VLIGVGGVGSIDDVWELLRAGASLVQLYTAFLYEGPTLPRDLNAGLLARLNGEGFRSIEDLIGAAERGLAPRAHSR